VLSFLCNVRPLAEEVADTLAGREPEDRRSRLLLVGYFANVVVFDTATVADHSTYADPHHLSSGVERAFVNGEHVLNSGKRTGTLPGSSIRGPEYNDPSTQTP